MSDFTERAREMLADAHLFPEKAEVAVAALLAREAAMREALLSCARQAEALKRPCGMDPESAQAVRNAQYQAISTTAHIALGTIIGPALPWPDFSREPLYTAAAAALSAARQEGREEAAKEADHWQAINTSHRCGEYIAAAIRALPRKKEV